MTEGHACSYCDRREPSEQLLALHVGEEHWDRCTERERAAFDRMYEAESEALLRFRIQALGLLVVLYFGFLFLYSIVG
ncbi:MAG: C2H2-type zinc finger protein [Halanaeroarchaeum sp.]